MADLEWEFAISGNAEDQLKQVESVLASLPSGLKAVQDQMRKLDDAVRSLFGQLAEDH